MYGAAVFRLSNRLAPGENADALAHDLLEATLAGLQSGVELRFKSRCDTREALLASGPVGTGDQGSRIGAE